MKGLMKYYLIDYIRSSRYIPPVTILIIWTVVSYTYVPNPIFSSYAVSCSVLFFVTAWIGLTFMENEDEVQTQITIIHAKGTNKVIIGKIISTFLFTTFLCLFVIVYPIIIGAFNRPLSLEDIVIAVCSHLLISLLSISITVHFSSLSKTKTLSSWLLLVLFLLVSLVQGGVENMFPSYASRIIWIFPPAYTIVEQLSHETISIDVALMLKWFIVF